MGLSSLINPVLVGLCAILVLPLFLSDPKYPGEITQLPQDLQEWYSRGYMMEINGRNIFYIYAKCSDSKVTDPPTFVIIHGFPSSSHEYHRVFDSLLQYGNVMVHDHVGFGFSEKPKTDYTYSMSEAADNALAIWMALGIESAHVISHDMGDSILTEILARRHRNMLPDYYKGFFNSVMFTNGGMKYSEINFRVGQILLSNIYVGPYFAKLSNRLGISNAVLKQQLWGIAGSTDIDNMNYDIEMMQNLLGYNGGMDIADKTIYYLWDRAHFEYRWFAALRELDIPCKIVWGESDAVAPKPIPEFISKLIPNSRLDYLPGAGHFIMLERPVAWVEHAKQLLELK